MRTPLLPQLPSGTASLPLGPAAQSLSAFKSDSTRPRPAVFIPPCCCVALAFPDSCEPCLPSPAATPPAGAGWLHEIKHDGFRMLVRRDADSVRLFTRNGHDWTGRFPLIVRAALLLKAASCLIDGEAVACDDNGLPVFDRLRYRRDDRRPDRA
jgi:ATP-dependent DNA ligase